MIAVHRVRPLSVLARQLRSALLLLLVITAAVSFFVGDRTNAAIIALILVVSVGLGFVNEYRAELAAQALHTQIHHDVVVRRDGRSQSVDVRDLVPGDLVRLEMGQVVAADIRVTSADELECDESVLTGESMPAEKSVGAVVEGCEVADMSSCVFMGTVVRGGNGEGVVVATGRRTRIRPDRGRVGGAPGGHGVPGGPEQVLRPARPGRGCAHHLDLRHQPRLAAAPPRIAAVLARDRRGHHPPAPPRGRHRRVWRPVAATLRARGARETPRVHRGPRRHRGPAHGQDGNTYRGQGQLRARDRRRRRARSGCAAPRAPLQRGHDRGRPRGRRQPARRRAVGGPRGSCGADRRRDTRRVGPVRPRAPDGLRAGRRSRRREDRRDEGRTRVGARGVRLRAGFGSPHARRRVRRRQPGGRGRDAPGPVGPDAVGRRRARADARRLPDLPRQAEGGRGRIAPALGRPRHPRQGRHGRQRDRGREGVPRPRPRRDGHDDRRGDRRARRRRARAPASSTRPCSLVSARTRRRAWSARIAPPTATSPSSATA